MKKCKINDRVLLRMVDQGKTQVETAEHFGVSKQAVNKRLKELRGKTTKVIVAKKLEQVTDHKIDAIQQLKTVNNHANWLLEHVMKWVKGDNAAIQVLEKNVRKVNVGTREEPEIIDEFKFKDPHEIALKAMSEIRGQLKLQLEIFQTLYSLQAAEEFQNTVLETIAEVDPNVRNEIIRRLNSKRTVRQTVRFS